MSKSVLLAVALCTLSGCAGARLRVAGRPAAPRLTCADLLRQVPVDAIAGTATDALLRDGARLVRTGRAPRRRALEWFGALGAGVSIPGSQDMKIKRHSGSGKLTNYLFSEDVSASTKPFVTLMAGAWGAHRWGFQVDASYWQTTVQPHHLINRGPPGRPAPMPPMHGFRQRRIGLYVSGLWRTPFPGDGPLDSTRRFLFVGGGLGSVWTRVEQGRTGWNWAFQLLTGASLPMSARTRVRLEFRYVVAPDADSPARAKWRIDTSGTPMFPGFAHKDTRFFVLLVGYQIDL